MSSPDLVASTVMNASAALLNDPIRQTYSYTAQLPYLTIALQELREHFEQNNIPVTQETSAVITMAAGQTQINFNAVGSPRLPDDLVEPAQLWERPTSTSDPFIPMTKRDYLPHYLEGILQTNFVYYTWNQQRIEVLPANQSNDIKIDYIGELFQSFVDQNSPINVINARTFLEYRTAALCAEFIERNLTSAQGLNAYAVIGIDRVTSIGVKGKQNIMTRRRPFRAGYKKRGWMT